MNPQQRLDSHSRRVAILRIGLPLAALVLVAILFWSPVNDLPGSRSLDVENSEGDQLVFSGRTEDGSVIKVTTENYVDSGELVLIERVSALMENPDGSQHRVMAQLAESSLNADHVDLKGGAVLQAGRELTVESTGFRLSLTDSSLQSLGPVTFKFDGGNGSAGEMWITRRPSEPNVEDSWSFIVFSNGVEVNFLEPRKPEL